MTEKNTPEERCAECDVYGPLNCRTHVPAPLADGVTDKTSTLQTVKPLADGGEILTREEFRDYARRLTYNDEPYRDTLIAHDAALRAEVERLTLKLKCYEPVNTYNGLDIDAWKARAEKAERERDEDRRREYGYSQQTVDALTGERDQLRARAEKAERERDEAVRLLGVFYDDRYGGYSDCEEDDCEWCMVRRETWPLVKDRTAESMRPTPCPHEARAEKLAAALREIADNPLPAEKGYECAWCNGVRKHHKECPCSRAARALAENDNNEGGKK